MIKFYWHQTWLVTLLAPGGGYMVESRALSDGLAWSWIAFAAVTVFLVAFVAVLQAFCYFLDVGLEHQ